MAEYRLGNVNRYKFEQTELGQFDVITCVGSARFINDIQIFYHRLVDHLTPNGIFLFERVLGNSDADDERQAMRDLSLETMQCFTVKEPSPVLFRRVCNYTIAAMQLSSSVRLANTP